MSDSNASARRHNSSELDLSLALDADLLLADLRVDTTALAQRTSELEAAFNRFVDTNAKGIPNDSVLAKAGDFVRQLSAHITAVDARRTSIKAPVLAAQRAIDGFFKANLAEPIESAKTAVTRSIEAYQRERREEAAQLAREAAALQRAEQGRLAIEAQRLAAEAERQDSPALMDAALEVESRATAAAAPVVTAHPAPVRSDYGTTVGTRVGPWKVRITNIALVPVQYLMINEPVLIATAKTNERIAVGEQPIPGVEFFRETRAAIR